MESTAKPDVPSKYRPVQLPTPEERASRLQSGPPIRVWPIKEDFPESTPNWTPEEYAAWRRRFMASGVYLHDLPSEEVARQLNCSRMQHYIETLLGADLSPGMIRLRNQDCA